MELRKIVYKSVYRRKNFFHKTFFAVCLILFSVFLFYNSFVNKHFDLLFLIFGIMTSATSLYLLISMLFFRKYILYNDSIVIYYNGLYFLKKEFYYKNFEEYSIEESKKDGYNNIYSEIIIYLSNSSLSLSSSNIENFEKLKTYLLNKSKMKNISLMKTYKKKKRNHKIAFLVFCLLSILFAVMIITTFLSDHKSIHNSDLKTIKSVLINKPEIIKAAKGGTTHIDIKLKGYDSFEFKLEYVNLRATEIKNFTNESMIGDSIELDILSDDFKKKINETKKMTFLEKHVDYKTIFPLGIRVNRINYLDLNAYNESKIIQDKKDKNVLIFMFVICLSIAIYQYYKSFYEHLGTFNQKN